MEGPDEVIHELHVEVIRIVQVVNVQVKTDLDKWVGEVYALYLNRASLCGRIVRTDSHPAQSTIVQNVNTGTACTRCIDRQASIGAGIPGQ